MSNIRLPLYVCAIPVAAYALILPEAYRVGLALAFFLYPVTLELRPIIGVAILANMTSSQSESVPQDARNRDALKAIAATVACIGCLSLSNVLSPLQFTDLLIVLACPLWLVQLSNCHHKALLTLLEDKSNLAAELQTERTSLEQSKQDLLCYIRCLVRAREDNNHLAKHVDELKTSKALEMDLTMKNTSLSEELRNVHTQLDEKKAECDSLKSKNSTLLDELDDLHTQLDETRAECYISHEQILFARRKESETKCRLDIELGYVSFKMEKLRKCLGNALILPCRDFEGVKNDCESGCNSRVESHERSSYGTAAEDLSTNDEGDKRGQSTP